MKTVLPRRAVFAGLLGASLAAAVIGAGCEKRTTPAGPAAAAAVETYVTRGRLESVNIRPGAEPMLVVHHEEIPTFKDRTGKVIGMREMVMDFPLAAGVTHEGYAPGDLLEIEFAVDWSKVPYHRATKITKLPAGTELKIGK